MRWSGRRNMKWKLLAGVVVAAAVGGGGVAVAAGGGGGHGSASGQAAGTAIAASHGPGGGFGGWGAGGGRRGLHGPPGAHRLGGVLAAAASYLGLSESSVQSQLRSGKTLAQIVQETGGDKNVDGLVQALVDASKAKLDAAVAAGKLTQAQEDTILSNSKQRFTDLVNGVRPARPHMRMPHPAPGPGTSATA